MLHKKWSLAGAAALLTLLIALAGIALNARIPTLPNGGVLTQEAAAHGIALFGWERTGPGQWRFCFTPEPGAGPLVLCLANRDAFSPPDGAEAADSSGEWYILTTRAGEPAELTVTAERRPRCWVMDYTCAAQSAQTRFVLQLMALVSFLTMAAAILALFHYKRQRELGCFLLYLAIMCGWSVLVFLLPVGRGGVYQLILHLLFSFAVLAPIWLCAAFAGKFFPAGIPQRLLLAAASGLFLLLSVSPVSPLRVAALLAGMVLCMVLLVRAGWHGTEAVSLLLLPCAVTVGFRVLVLLPGLETRLFVESFPFFVMRCARIYDLPFALGCLTFVCRKFALQFDRTEQLARELDRRVAQRTQALTEETEARKSMMINIFHDLRSPLFAVSSGLDTLAAAPQALPTLLPALQQRVAFLRRLTEDLFLAAKLEQKQVLLNEDRVALNEAAAAVCLACQPEARSKGVSLTVDAAQPLPVWGDETRLQQVLQNLVTNAIHYTPAGGRAEVACSAAGGVALVSVRDTGCGIAPEDQAQVFHRYFHTSAQNKHDSTGLGLTIAQELARLHHGEITLESAPGEGSCFTLRLPLLSEE